MPCPFCEAATKVYDSRPIENNTIWRRRMCNGCGISFSTYESARPELVIISEAQQIEIMQALKRDVEHYVISELTGVPVDAIHQIATAMNLPRARRDTARSK
jgi:hypothetical protein